MAETAPPPYSWLVLRLEAPLLAFGGVAIDQIGPTRDFPSASLLTGLLANALGWRRTEAAAHQRLQDRLIFAARLDRAGCGGILADSQNAKLEKSDRGWTTRGTPEGRDGASYDSPHRRRRDYHQDAALTVVLRVSPVAEAPTLEDLEQALIHPARPLFLGRKPCLPSVPLFQATLEATTAHEALCRAPSMDTGTEKLRALWPSGEGPMEGEGVDQIVSLADQRNWITGLHGGTRTVVEGRIPHPPQEGTA